MGLEEILVWRKMQDLEMYGGLGGVTVCEDWEVYVGLGSVCRIGDCCERFGLCWELLV